MLIRALTSVALSALAYAFAADANCAQSGAEEAQCGEANAYEFEAFSKCVIRFSVHFSIL